MQKKSTSKRKRDLIKIYRWLFSALILLILFYLTEDQSIEEIRPDEVPVLYANVCHDDLEKIFVEAVRCANHSILLIIYSLSDVQLIRALNTQAEKGIEVKVIHDRTTPVAGFQKLCGRIENESIKRSGLMHQKILVIDSEKIWMGSANMTTESLKIHDNLVIGLMSPQLASVIDRQTPFASMLIGGQPIEYWDLPKTGKEGLQRLIGLIDGAKKTIRIAMFTWTHLALTEAVIRAHTRGIDVEIILDHGQAQGVCQQTVEALTKGGIKLRLSSGLGLLHHKCAWIDEEILVNGSANWTQSAFTRNRDCFLILHHLTEQQNAKMRSLWKKTFSRSLDKKHFSILGNRPIFISDYSTIPMAA